MKKSLSGMWEFSGRKVENGESPSEALQGESAEELERVVEIGGDIVAHSHEYDFRGCAFDNFYSTLLKGQPKQTEHEKIAWVRPAGLTNYE